MRVDVREAVDNPKHANYKGDVSLCNKAMRFSKRPTGVNIGVWLVENMVKCVVELKLEPVNSYR